jgi:hypothetical protein
MRGGLGVFAIMATIGVSAMAMRVAMFRGGRVGRLVGDGGEAEGHGGERTSGCGERLHRKSPEMARPDIVGDGAIHGRKPKKSALRAS